MCNRGYSKYRGHHYGAKHHPKYQKWMQHKMQGRWNYPPVNIQELDDRFELYVYASGFSKDEIQLKISNNHLLISGSKPEDSLNQNWKRQEFTNDQFKRKFELSEKVDQENISAKFEAGVLKVTLKKLPGFETIEQEIKIA